MADIQRVALGHLQAAEQEDADEFQVTAITAGTANNLEYSEEVLQASLIAGLWDRVSVFINHPDALEATRAGGRDLEQLAGVFYQPIWRPDSTGGDRNGKEVMVSQDERGKEGQRPRSAGIAGHLRAAGPKGPLLAVTVRRWLADEEAGKPTPDVGLSADLLIERRGRKVTAIRKVLALDAVFMPARGGAFERALNAIEGGTTMSEAEMNTVETTETTETVAEAPESESLQQDVTALREQVSRLAERTTIRGAGEPRVQVGPSPIEQVQLALEKWWGLPVPDHAAGIPRLRSFRDFYTLTTGDAEMRGGFMAERVQLANATTTTMAELVRNVMNKAIAYRWETLGKAGYLWWETICHHEDFETLQQVGWVSVGGFGDLPDVAEGGAYQELTWDDSRETADWDKMGGYIGLTLEMIDRDQNQRIRAIPSALATAALRTLSSKVASIFTDNAGVGPTLSDSKALFHADHSNLATSALDSTAWEAAIQSMFKQTDLNSGKRLGIRPRFLLMPIDLEKTGLQLVGSDVEPTTNVFYTNVRAGTATVLVPPEWTDANDWAAAADPKVLPGIGIGYRFGRQPEVFIADQESVGSMFTNDELRLKVRYLVAVGVVNYRALYKANVT